MPMSERYKIVVTKKNIVCTTSPTRFISVTILLYLTKDFSKSKSGGVIIPKIQKTMSKQAIFNEFLRQTTDLMKYMNAYSLTLREFISEDDFSELFERLAEVDSKHETYSE